MAYRARLYNFTPSTLIQSAQVDAEFDQIISLLNGTATSDQIKYTHNAATIGFSVNGTGGGVLQNWEVAGVEKAKVNASGQFESVLATGTAPLVVASTTVVTNLNADTVDGVHGTNLLVDNAATQLIDGGGVTTILRIGGDTGGALYFVDADAGGEPGIRLTQNATGVDVEYWNGTDTLTPIAAFLNNGQITNGLGEELASKVHVDASKTFWSWGIFYAGAIDTSIVQPSYIVPSGTEGVEAETIKVLYKNGTPTTDSTFVLRHKNSVGTIQNSRTVTLATAAVTGQVYETDITTDWVMAANDYLEVVVTANGGHRDITFQVHGIQSLVTP